MDFILFNMTTLSLHSWGFFVVKWNSRNKPSFSLANGFNVRPYAKPANSPSNAKWTLVFITLKTILKMSAVSAEGVWMHAVIHVEWIKCWMWSAWRWNCRIFTVYILKHWPQLKRSYRQTLFQKWQSSSALIWSYWLLILNTRRFFGNQYGLKILFIHQSARVSRCHCFTVWLTVSC